MHQLWINLLQHNVDSTLQRTGLLAAAVLDVYISCLERPYWDFERGIYRCKAHSSVLLPAIATCVVVNYVILFLQITQISCFDNNNLAPSGCTQYYTGMSGTIQSFNWITNNANNVQLANQHQKICFRSVLSMHLSLEVGGYRADLPILILNTLDCWVVLILISTS